MIKTKIIATLGPATSTQAVLRKMFIKGLDVVRLNFSHGTHLEHLKRIELVRSLNKKMRRAIKIMQDLEGYRIRVGKLSDKLNLKKHSKFYLTKEDIIGRAELVPFDYKGSLKNIKKGTLIYIDDGKIALLVRNVLKKKLKVETVVPGILKEHKGINIPECKLDFEAITDKDKDDVRVAIEKKLDYVAQSFVRNKKDIKKLQIILKSSSSKSEIYAKIESTEALNNLDGIIDEADGIIVARGDLGICIPIYKVPVTQKEIIRRCRLKKKPVVVATQMLDSMTEDPFPTRAEVSDVSNAVLDGATHLLLSGETAIGRYPHKAIDMMNKVIEVTEEYKR